MTMGERRKQGGLAIEIPNQVWHLKCTTKCRCTGQRTVPVEAAVYRANGVNLGGRRYAAGVLLHRTLIGIGKSCFSKGAVLLFTRRRLCGRAISANAIAFLTGYSISQPSLHWHSLHQTGITGSFASVSNYFESIQKRAFSSA